MSSVGFNQRVKQCKRTAMKVNGRLMAVTIDTVPLRINAPTSINIPLQTKGHLEYRGV